MNEILKSIIDFGKIQEDKLDDFEKKRQITLLELATEKRRIMDREMQSAEKKLSDAGNKSNAQTDNKLKDIKAKCENTLKGFDKLYEQKGETWADDIVKRVIS